MCSASAPAAAAQTAICVPSSAPRPPGKVVVDRDAIDHRHRADGSLHSTQHLETEARAVRKRAAVYRRCAGSRTAWRTARSGSRAQRGSRRRRNRPPSPAHRHARTPRPFPQSVARHRLRHDSLVGDLVHRMRDRRRRDRRLAADVAPRMAAAVPELDRRLRATSWIAATSRVSPGRKRSS